MWSASAEDVAGRDALEHTAVSARVTDGFVVTPEASEVEASRRDSRRALAEAVASAASAAAAAASSALTLAMLSAL